MANTKVGLIQKYEIEKNSGESIDKEARYFVLRYDNFGNDDFHRKACRKALKTYANAIKNDLPLLYKDLLKELKKYK
jgi:hypothetical protein